MVLGRDAGMILLLGWGLLISAAQSEAVSPHDAAAALDWRCGLDERLAGFDLRALRSAIVVVMSKMLGQR
jgi:hypothetical protein